MKHTSENIGVLPDAVSEDSISAEKVPTHKSATSADQYALKSSIWQQRWFPYVSTTVILALAIALWELYVRLSNISPLVLPGPWPVAQSFVKLLGTPRIWTDSIFVTLQEAMIGLALAIVVGTVLGYLMGKFNPVEATARPFVVVSQVVPEVALIPLFILWFGFGPTSKIAIAFLLAVFPYIINVSFGVRSIPSDMHDMLTSLGAGPLQRFRKLEGHYLLPQLLTASEMSVILALIGAIVGEYLAGDKGLGVLIVTLQRNLQVADLYGSIVIMSALGLILYGAVSIVKRLTIPWHESVTSKKFHAR